MNTRVCNYVCVPCVRMYPRMYIRIVCMYVPMYVCMYVCMYVAVRLTNISDSNCSARFLLVSNHSHFLFYGFKKRNW